MKKVVKADTSTSSSNGTSLTQRVELLSPAGSFDCFMAAVNAGADAVYLGLERFGARANAANLTEEELERALDIAHLLDRKIYLTVNTLLRDDELDGLYDMLYKPYISGLDGVIVQDVGVMAHIREHFPLLPIHASTQAAVTSSEAVELLGKFGIKRIVPARELSLDEIRRLKEETHLEIECFIHGSMCYSYSGKCLLSSFIGGRSGNRGRCAQPCRLAYDDRYLLSLKDMCTIDMIPQLIGAGISSFKIEGRMKSSDYVYSVTSIYRKYIDRYYMGDDGKVEDEDRKRLIRSYTRSGGCEGYYRCHNDSFMITPESSSYTVGDEESSVERYADIRKTIPVTVRCNIKAGEFVGISVEGKGQVCAITTDVMPDGAVNRALTSKDVAKQLEKTGGTVFDVTGCLVNIDEGLFIPNGKINSIRREGIAAFSEQLLDPFRRKDAVPGREDECRINDKEDKSTVQYTGNTDDETASAPVINAAVSDMDQFAAASGYADGIIIPYTLFDGEYIKKGHDMPQSKLYIRLPYVVRHDGYANTCESLRRFIENALDRYDISGFYVSNAESLAILGRFGYSGDMIADIHMYAYNRRAYDFYRKCGITKTTVPVELNEKELIRRGLTGEELVIYGRLPMMISANCIYNTRQGCQKTAAGHRLHITDRKGEKLFVYCSCSDCTNIIYNSSVLLLADEKVLMGHIKPSSVRFEFTDESDKEVLRILRSYKDGRDDRGSVGSRLIERYTRGHIKRGVS